MFAGIWDMWQGEDGTRLRSFAILEPPRVYRRLMEAAAAKPRRFQIVLVHSFSRFFRDHFELEFNVRRLAKQGIRLVSITQELGDDPTAVIMRQIMALFDEYQSKENAKHTLRAMNENARQGFWNGSRPPFGYRAVEAERRGQKIKKRLDIDPVQAETVRLIFDLYLEGDGVSGALGLKAIVNRLNAQGYRTQAGSKFSCKFIHEILTRPAYTGTHYFNAVEAKTGRQKSAEDMVAITIPAIIPKDRFEDVQLRLKHNAHRERPVSADGAGRLCHLWGRRDGESNAEFSRRAEAAWRGAGRA